MPSKHVLKFIKKKIGLTENLVGRRDDPPRVQADDIRLVLSKPGAEVAIYKRKTGRGKKERKHALDQESDQKKPEIICLFCMYYGKIIELLCVLLIFSFQLIILKRLNYQSIGEKF